MRLSGYIKRQAEEKSDFICKVGNIQTASSESAVKKILSVFTAFFKHHLRDVKKGGIRIFSRKIGAVLLAPFALVTVVFVRALSSWVLIRFGDFHSTRIGHFAANTEIYLCERDAGMHNRKPNFDIFYYGAHASNCQLKKMWDRTVRVYNFAKLVDKANRLLPGAQKHVIPMFSDIDIHGLLRKSKPHLSFTIEEERLGEEELRKLGILSGDSFICFHARDSAYLNATHPDNDWRHHDYRDTTISNYILAAEEISRRGYFAVRMGALVKMRLNVVNPKIIDYASNGRNDFLDIFLSAKCKFFICDTAGISSLPMIFRRPIAWVNYIPLKFAPIGGPDDIFIPKKLWVRGEKRFLTFSEICDSDIGDFLMSSQYEDLGIDVVENTSEEIRDLAVEIDMRLKGLWQETEEDRELQKLFWRIFKHKYELDYGILPRIGREFLRANTQLLSKAKNIVFMPDSETVVGITE